MWTKSFILGPAWALINLEFIFRDSFWPNGIQSAPYPERDENTKMRTRIAAKTAMMCTISDELKHVVGSETFRKGIMCVFEMFQNKTLNKRLLYVLIEGIMKTLFHSNNFDKTFRTLHSHFQKVKKESKQLERSSAFNWYNILNNGIYWTYIIGLWFVMISESYKALSFALSLSIYSIFNYLLY